MSFMKITYKLMLGFVFVSLFVIVSGIFGIIYTNASNSRLNVVTEITTPTSNAVNDMIVSLSVSYTHLTLPTTPYV